MRLLADGIRLKDGELVLSLKTTRREAEAGVHELKGVVARDKLLSVEIKQYREPRSLNANAYFWVLAAKLAAHLGTTKDEIYLEMLDRYGVFTHIIVKPEVVERVKAEWRTTRELGEATVNGKTGIQLMCFFGSSTYNTKEMSVLIDGVVSECKELGIETIPSDQLENLKKSWGC